MRVRLQRKQGACTIDVHFAHKADGIIALFGPSGAGKSSIINMVAGLQQPDSGSIHLGERCLFDSERGINLPPEHRRVGYVFQESLLFPHLSVRSNLLYGPRHGTAARRAIATEDEVVSLLGLEDLLHRKPATLSGGEKQRVAFGRAVLSHPELLLMDEPLASLDTARKTDMLHFIKTLNTRFHLPILYVSHIIDEIRALTDNVLYLAEGRLTAGQNLPGNNKRLGHTAPYAPSVHAKPPY